MLLSPFRGFLFAPELAAGEVTCPPYDVIDDPEQFRDRSPHNIAHLLLPEGGAYTEAAARLRSWTEAGIVNPDPTPRFYRYEMSHTATTAVGVVGALAVEELGARIIAHEETMPRAAADRYQLLEATGANLDLIVCLSTGPALTEAIPSGGILRREVNVDGVEHRLFDLTDPDAVLAVASAIDAGRVAIADGHHRYRTALDFAAGQGEGGPWNRIMALVLPAETSGLEIRPIHRAIDAVDLDPRRLAPMFEWTDTKAVVPDLPGAIVLVPGSTLESPPLLLMPRASALADLPPPWRRASTAVARELLWPALDVTEDQVHYHPDPARLLAHLSPGGAVALMAPVPESAVSEAGESGLRFPQKTTYFWPKPLSGLVLRLLSPP